MPDFMKPISIAEEPILTFGILLLMLIFVPLLFRQFKITGIAGLIIAGAIVGPNGLGLIEARGVIDVLGVVGLLYLMFMAGLEMNLNRFEKEKSNAIVFGSATFLIPMIIGTFVFTLFGFSLPASLLIASMFASHTLITYPIIMRLNLTQETSVSSAIGATVITDTAALLVLAGVARSVEGESSIVFWGTLAILFAIYLAFMFFALPRFSYHFFRLVDDSGRYTYVYVIGMMLICSWLAHIIGTEAILGAFLSGLAFNRLLTNKGTLKNRIDFFGDAFFIPLFLIFVGMQVDFSILFSDAYAWGIMGAMLITGIFSKWLAAYFTGKLLNFNTDQTWMVFGMTVTDGAATLAAVFIGFELGIFGVEVFNGAILLILATSLIGPPLVERFGFRLSGEIGSDQENISEKEQRILVPLSNPKTSTRLIELSSNICQTDKTYIYPLTVLNTVKDHLKKREQSTTLLELATGQIQASDHMAKPIFEANLNVADGIADAAKKYSITDIVIGWNGDISARVKVFGGIIDQLLHSATQRIFVCKLEQAIFSFKKAKIILSPKMGHDRHFKKLIQMLFLLAANLNMKVEVYYVMSEKIQLKNYADFTIKQIDPEFREFISFDLLTETSFDSLQPTDLLIVTNKHTQNYGWTHGINTIPRHMAKNYPQNSFIIAYPSGDDGSYSLDQSLIYSN
jgi:Kef-type K+ transport system membrane component KefB